MIINGILLFISGSEIFIVILIALLLFGADKIPEMVRTFKKGMTEVKKASEQIKKEIDESDFKDVKKDFEDFKKIKDFNDTIRGTKL